MRVGRLIVQLTLFAAGLLVGTGVWPMYLLAQDHSEHADGAPLQPGALVRIVRQATERFRDKSVVENEGYGDVEGQPQRDVCQLAPEGVLRFI